MKKRAKLLVFLIIFLLIPTIAGATSQKFNASIAITSGTTPTTTTTTPTSTGGGNAGPAITKNLVLITKNLDVSTIINTKKIRQIELYNEGETKISIGIIKSKDLEEILDIKKDSFDLAPKEKKKIDIEIIAPSKPGIYNGKMIINGQVILVVINVNTKELLYSIDTAIPKTIISGEILKSQIVLSQIGEKKEINITINYIVKDFEGNILLTESEVISFKDQTSFIREFITKKLPYGDYILGIELIDANNIATSSAHFKIEKRFLPFPPYVLIIMAIGIVILIIAITIIKRKHKKVKSKIKKHKLSISHRS